MQALSDGVIEKLTQYLTGVNALNRFQYLNYADTKQNPIQGYGETNVGKLRAASRRYDPTRVFQKLVKGGFKIPVAQVEEKPRPGAGDGDESGDVV